VSLHGLGHKNTPLIVNLALAGSRRLWSIVNKSAERVSLFQTQASLSKEVIRHYIRRPVNISEGIVFYGWMIRVCRSNAAEDDRPVDPWNRHRRENLGPYACSLWCEPDCKNLMERLTTRHSQVVYCSAAPCRFKTQTIDLLPEAAGGQGREDFIEDRLRALIPTLKLDHYIGGQ
jgi:hypothetical protein